MTEEVNFPRGIKAQAVALRVDAVGSKTRLLLIEVRVAAFQLHMGRVVEVSLHEHGAGRPDPVERGAQIQIGAKRTVDEAIEFSVAELLPPKRLGGLRDERGRLGVLHERRSNRRHMIIRADGASGHQKRPQDYRKYCFHRKAFIASGATTALLLRTRSEILRTRT